MEHIQIDGNDFVADLGAIARKYSGEHTEDTGLCTFHLNGSMGKGYIKAYKVSDELQAFVFNLKLNEDLVLEVGNTNGTVIDFIFCLEGFITQGFSRNNSFEEIGFRQNSIVRRLKNKKNMLHFPSSSEIKMSYLLFNASLERHPEEDIRFLLSARIGNLNNALELKEGHRYLGRICFRTAEYVKVLVNKTVNSVEDVFFIEAAILNTLASQIKRYQADTKGKHVNSPIRPSEIDKIHALHAFIMDNITENLQVERLSSISGLSPAKLQLGFKYLYNNNVASYITQKRVDLAAKLMEDGEMNISEVVYAIGFTSRSYFSKIFKRRFGVRPSDYVRSGVKPIVA
ncbi:helix-turn-helix transcriptional regulator [Flavobacteriaceae bacterium TP-CH-4]|uniref:Helix-turn-helix transcriptional regulator n=1 Tax=Pelagihabitans pacificus TaxID=2696054 RepID=A0A967AW68_9FLAO|nr:AraC family transcriptional regulator [Pelagihabitans pacificus]NHF61042.1 helix-turn-helix transcriptional regulator [Pelagihabitans pacificus]